MVYYTRRSNEAVPTLCRDVAEFDPTPSRIIKTVIYKLGVGFNSQSRYPE
jgi:hypothetical protein